MVSPQNLTVTEAADLCSKATAFPAPCQGFTFEGATASDSVDTLDHPRPPSRPLPGSPRPRVQHGVLRRERLLLGS